MNRILLYLSLFLGTAFIISCNENNPNNVTDDGNTSLWVALYEGEKGLSEFKDNKCYIYRDGKLQYAYPFLSEVVRNGTDVYALVREGESYVWNYSIWKNGKRLYGLDSEGGFPPSYIGGCDLYVVNNDVYSCGTEDVFDSVGKIRSHKGKVWKNEKPLLELESRGSTIWPNRIFVEGSDIYVAGAIYDSEKKEKGPAVWKNGKLFFIGNDNVKGSGWNHLTDIKCYFGNLYYAGSWCDEGDGGQHARIWKNNTILYDLAGKHRWADVYQMGFKDGCLYAVGYNQSANGVLWKDGEIMWEIKGTQQKSITIIGDDIYTAGVEGTSTGGIGRDRLAQIWKNGKVYQSFDYCQVVELIESCK